MTYACLTWEYEADAGRAIAQAVIRWLPTAAARVRPGHAGFVVDKVALGQVSS
jgi:hypothetical protein